MTTTADPMPADQPAVPDPAAVDAAVPDAAAVDAADWPDRPLTGPTAGARDGRFQVVYRQSALDAIHLHGQTRTDVEVGGVLIGTGCRDAHGPYLLVEACIPALDANSRSTNVTFTADAWHSIQTVMDRDHAERKMIGWYHTHPGFGIFLSGMDLFICDNFFNLPWQIAFVYDPLGGDEGNFVWRGGKPTREPVLLEDDVTPAAAAVPLIGVADALTGTDPAGPAGPTADPDPPWNPAPALSEGEASTSAEAVQRLQSQVVELMERVGRLERRQRPLLATVVFILAFMAMYAIGQWPGMTTPTPTPTPTVAPTPTPTPSAVPTPTAVPQQTPAPRPNSPAVRGH